MGLHGESCSLPSSGQVPGLLGEGRSSAGAEGPLRPGLAACPMRPRGDECRVRSVERQELRARAGPGKTGKTPLGRGGWRRRPPGNPGGAAGEGQRPEGPGAAV